MSVYKHEYRAYNGEVTPVWTRIFVLARYGYSEAWSSKITVAIFILCLIPVLVALFGIYLANNPVARLMLGGAGSKILAIDANYFQNVLETQSWMALVLASWIAPRLITFDLADNALPILLSHPITRFGYIFGKFIALFANLSIVTWVPCLLLFVYQSYYSPQPWAMHNLRVAVGLFAGAVIWITFLSILGLGLSSWVKWRVVATGIIFAAVLVPAAVGAIVSQVLRTQWGFIFNFPVIMSLLWGRMLGAHGIMDLSLPTPAILAMLALACFLCIAMLNKRIRAREVVRG